MAGLDCWICNNAPADSGEHKSKKSDLKAVFGEASPQRPLYLNDSKARNHKVQSLDADRLKWTSVICGYCNSTRTQPHDYRVGIDSRRTTKAGAQFEAG